MDTKRFNNIRNLHDLKLEKARLRYELLVIENRLNDNIDSLRDLTSISSFFSRITYGFQIAQTVYSKVSAIISKFSSWKNKRKEKKEKKKKKDYDNAE